MFRESLVVFRVQVMQCKKYAYWKAFSLPAAIVLLKFFNGNLELRQAPKRREPGPNVGEGFVDSLEVFAFGYHLRSQKSVVFVTRRSAIAIIANNYRVAVLRLASMQWVVVRLDPQSGTADSARFREVQRTFATHSAPKKRK